MKAQKPNTFKRIVTDMGLFILKAMWLQIYYCFSIFIYMVNDEEDEARIARSSCNERIVDEKDLGCRHSFIKTTDEKIMFPIKNSVIVVTDIVESTKLYNQNPLRMKSFVLSHYNIIHTLVRKFSGHIVLNEGDSFHLLFQNLEFAIKFVTEFFKEHNKKVPFFEVRSGIAQGKYDARNIDGVKLFGKCIDEVLGNMSHNQGKKVCIRNKILYLNKIKDQCPLFCLH